jgi:hypothetical protein
MIRKLKYFDEATLRAYPRESQAVFGKDADVRVVELVTVAMPLMHKGLTVGIGRLRARLESAGVEAQTHGSPYPLDPALFRHEIYHWMGGGSVEFRAVGAAEATHIARELDHGTLHTQA